jgi:uncharacterized membrane protein YebE (DUF533 family)
VNCDYRLRAATPFLTIYFIPLISIGGTEEFVQCGRCKNRFQKPVLAGATRDAVVTMSDQFADEVTRCMVLIVMEDGYITPREVDALMEISQRFLDRKVSREEIARLASLAGQTQVRTANYVRSMSKRWNLEQRRQALQAMFLAASSDGKLRDDRASTLAELQSSLQMNDIEFREAIADAVERMPT